MDGRAWLLLDAAVLVLALSAFASAAALRPERRAPTALGLLFLASGVAFAVHGPRIPTGWITVLQEGLSLLHVRELYGRGAHGEGGLNALLNLLGPMAAGDGLGTVVRWNVGLSLANAGLYLVLATRVVGRVPALGLALLFALHPIALHVTFSELPNALLTTCFLLGVALADTAADPQLAVRARWLSVSALAGLVVVAASLRLEMLVLGVPAAFTSALTVRHGASRIDDSARRALSKLLGLLGGPTRGWILAVLALFVGRLALGALAVPGLGVGPDLFSIAGFTLPAALAMVLPLGLVLLFVLGAVHALPRPSQFLWLPATVFGLFHVYLTQGHWGTAPPEMFRYLGGVMPAVFLLALFGWREVRALGERLGWREPQLRAARALVLLSFGCWNLMGLVELDDGLEFNSFSGSAPRDPSRLLVMARDQQLEERYLLDLLDRFPTCAFVERVVPTESVADRGFNDAPVAEWGALWFGRDVGRARGGPTLTELDGSVRELAASAEAGRASPCVLYFRGLDCNLANAGDACDRDVDGLELLDERRGPGRRYYFHVRMQGELRLGVYRVR